MKARNWLIIIIVCLALILSCHLPASALKNSIDLTEVGMGARPIGLGGAYIAIADDACAIFTNPAGLGLQNRISFVSMSTQLLLTVDYKLAAFSFPTQYGNFGIGYIGAASPAGDHTYYEGTTTVEAGPINYSNQMLILSYATDISGSINNEFVLEGWEVKNLAVGANLKFLSQGFEGFSNAPTATGLEADLGVIYMPTDKFTVGAMLHNILRGSGGESLTWSTGEKEEIPVYLGLGCSYKVIDNVLVAIDSDLSSMNTVYRGGIEWQVIPLLALRAGIDQKNTSINDNETGISSAYSLGAGIMWSGFRFDYAYKQNPVFTEYSTHYFSLGYAGEPMLKPVKAEESPLAQYEKLIEGKGGNPEPVPAEQIEQIEKTPK